MSEAIEGFVGPARRKVAIRRDQEDYIIVLQPEDLVSSNPSAAALRKACNFLRWEVVSDTVPETNDPASW